MARLFGLPARSIACVLALACGRARAATPGGDFVIAGGTSPGDWAFAMGPSGSPDMTLKYLHQGKDGSIGFDCRRGDGGEQIGFTVKSGSAPTRSKEGRLTVRLAVDGAGHDLAVEPAPALPAAPDGMVAFTSSGDAASSVLGAMGAAGATSLAARIEVDSVDGRKLIDAPLPMQRDVAAIAARICHGWAEEAVKARVKNATGQPAPADSSSVTVPGG